MDKVKTAQSDFEASFNAAINTTVVSGGVGAGMGKGNASVDHTNKQSGKETLLLESKGGNHESLAEKDWSKWAKGLSDDSSTWEVIDVAKSNDVCFGELKMFTKDEKLKDMMLQYGVKLKQSQDEKERQELEAEKKRKEAEKKGKEAEKKREEAEREKRRQEAIQRAKASRRRGTGGGGGFTG
eukprot:140127_1